VVLARSLLSILQALYRGCEVVDMMPCVLTQGDLSIITFCCHLVQVCSVKACMRVLVLWFALILLCPWHEISLPGDKGLVMMVMSLNTFES